MRLQKEGEVNNRHGQCGYPPLKCARVFIFSSHEQSSPGDWGDYHGTWHVVLRLTLLTLQAEYDGQKKIGDEENEVIFKHLTRAVHCHYAKAGGDPCVFF